MYEVKGCIKDGNKVVGFIVGDAQNKMADTRMIDYDVFKVAVGKNLVTNVVLSKNGEIKLNEETLKESVAALEIAATMDSRFQAAYQGAKNMTVGDYLYASIFKLSHVQWASQASEKTARLAATIDKLMIMDRKVYTLFVVYGNYPAINSLMYNLVNDNIISKDKIANATLSSVFEQPKNFKTLLLPVDALLDNCNKYGVQIVINENKLESKDDSASSALTTMIVVLGLKGRMLSTEECSKYKNKIAAMNRKLIG